jgi:glutamate synthase (NADPH/NADH) large chain
VAEETRELMAQLGVTKLEDLVGRLDLLEVIEGVTKKQRQLDFSKILTDAGVSKDKPHLNNGQRNHPWDKGDQAEQMVQQILPAISAKTGGTFHFHLKNTGRSIGARLSGEIAKRYGNHGMNDTPITLKLTGVAGQSFGVWNAGGLNLHLEGDANDYVGKGMAGGEIVIVPPKDSAFVPRETPIVGNTCLYGATGGKLFAYGTGGERFGVRNSGAIAVLEGVGDHGCEYMTGGTVVVLGKTGVNFGAGMSGGMAFLFDENNQVPDRVNAEMVEFCRIDTEETQSYRHYLKSLLKEYHEKTGSATAERLLANFTGEVGKFWLVKSRAIGLDRLLDLFSKTH